MNFAVIVSTRDLAGVTIKEALMRAYAFEETKQEFDSHPVYKFQNIKLFTTKKESVSCENIDKKIDADIYVFATRHQSQSGIPSLSVHGIGNWGRAEKEYGGKDKTLCISPANYLKEALIFLEKNNSIGFDIVQECTHHGPYLEKPVMFIEIGSTLKQWGNKDAAEIIARAIVHMNMIEPLALKTAIGIGGLHTAPNFKKIMTKSDIAVSHICPKYNLENLNEDLIIDAMRKSYPATAEMAILDWKGLGEHKERIVNMLNNLKVQYIKTSSF
jgi:D-aminoacyl-tRNA deacylase